MNDEINRDFYCSADLYSDTLEAPVADYRCYPNGNPGCQTCHNHHRKHPTPEQFEQEYGTKYPDDGAVYFQLEKGLTFPDGSIWGVCRYITTKMYNNKNIVCACTPFGCPPDDWRLE